MMYDFAMQIIGNQRGRIAYAHTLLHSMQCACDCGACMKRAATPIRYLMKYVIFISQECGDANSNPLHSTYTGKALHRWILQKEKINSMIAGDGGYSNAFWR